MKTGYWRKPVEAKACNTLDSWSITYIVYRPLLEGVKRFVPRPCFTEEKGGIEVPKIHIRGCYPSNRNNILLARITAS
jgi:hypothetical protein